MKIDYKDNKNEYLEELRTRRKKEQKKDSYMSVITGIVGLMAITLWLLKDFYLGLILFFVLLGSWILFSFLSAELISVAVREDVISTISESEEEGKLLEISFNEDNKKIYYVYDLDGKVYEEDFPVEKVEVRNDIDEDTLYLGEEFIYYKKYTKE